MFDISFWWEERVDRQDIYSISALAGNSNTTSLPQQKTARASTPSSAQRHCFPGRRGPGQQSARSRRPERRRAWRSSSGLPLSKRRIHVLWFMRVLSCFPAKL
ncbi:hypothetical protein BC937DRAFT_88214 [Endogone sp. FLAS-F59071]|nr:hypothetical protein BC937DRAFT_88214 [Endogone sp. FLAS-F59071]|eukprot:RUS18881.1 hypothetical protein BC937DRAFT_88214 [Endogone sp. FLAS-F59071]